MKSSAISLYGGDKALRIQKTGRLSVAVGENHGDRKVPVVHEPVRDRRHCGVEVGQYLGLCLTHTRSVCRRKSDVWHYAQR